MPDIESLMQEWPPGFEDALRDVCIIMANTRGKLFYNMKLLQIEFPTADMDCDLAQYTDIVCGK